MSACFMLLLSAFSDPAQCASDRDSTHTSRTTKGTQTNLPSALHAWLTVLSCLQQRHYARWTFTPQPSSAVVSTSGVELACKRLTCCTQAAQDQDVPRSRAGSKSGARFKDVVVTRAVWRTRTRQAWSGSFGQLEALTIVTVTAAQPNPSHSHLLTVGKRLSEKTHPYVDRLVQLFNSGMDVKGTPPKCQLVKLQDQGPTVLFQSQDPSAIPFALFIKSPEAGRMSMPERVQMLACLASALSYLEAQGCCHALLQPSLVAVSETQGPIVQGIDSCLAMMQRPAAASVTIRMEPSYVSGRLAQLKSVHSWAVPRYYAPELLLSPALELDQFWPYSTTFSEATLEGMHAYSWASLAVYALAGTPPGDGLTNESFLLEQRLGAVPRLPLSVSECSVNQQPSHLMCEPNYSSAPTISWTFLSCACNLTPHTALALKLFCTR